MHSIQTIEEGAIAEADIITVEIMDMVTSKVTVEAILIKAL